MFFYKCLKTFDELLFDFQVHRNVLKRQKTPFLEKKTVLKCFNTITRIEVILTFIYKKITKKGRKNRKFLRNYRELFFLLFQIYLI